VTATAPTANPDDAREQDSSTPTRDGTGPASPVTVTIRRSLPSVVSAAVVVSLARPLSWLLGVLGFMAGGGLAIVAWPIVVVPTPTGLQNALGGPVSTLVFGAPSARLFGLIVGAAGAAALLLVVGVVVGAWAERQGIPVTLDAAFDEGLDPDGAVIVRGRGVPGSGRVAVLRFLSLAPVAAAGTVAWSSIYDATYRELILPDDLTTPLPFRVVNDVPWLLVALLLVWLASDAAASVGVRRLVLERRPVLVAWLLGWTDLVRRPARVLPTALFGLVALLVPLAPALLATGIGSDRVRDLLASDPEPWIAVAAIALWVGAWLGGLVLVGVGAAVRAAAWTLELPRRSVTPSPR
jgi:hypothetical protein